MKKISKGISVLLAICMIIAMVPAAFAAGEATPVTVSMKAEELGSIDTSNPYSVWKYREDVRLNDTDFTRLNYDCACKLLRGDSVSANTFFSFDVQAVEGTYAIEITPITTGLGCSYNVFVDGQFAGRVDTRDDTVGDSAFVIASSAQKLNTLALAPDEDGWVNIRLENVSAYADLSNPYNFRMGFSEISLIPLADQETALAVSDVEMFIDGSTETSVSENVTHDFVIKAKMNDGSYLHFDTADASTNAMSVALADGSTSVSLSDVAVKPDGIYGKISGLTAGVASTVNVTVKYNGEDTVYPITVTPKGREAVTLSMKNDEVTFTGLNAGNGEFNSGTLGITWTDGNTLYYPEGSSVRKYYANFRLANSGERAFFSQVDGATPKLAFKVKAAGGAYKVKVNTLTSTYGAVYAVYVDGKYAGEVNCNGANRTASAPYYDPAPGSEVALNTLTVTPDSDGWVIISLEYLRNAVPMTTATDRLGMLFSSIVLEPVVAPTVSALTEDISNAEISAGSSVDFVIGAKMSDGSSYYFPTNDENNKITASVSSQSSVGLSNFEMKNDGLHGQITGYAEDDEDAKATITVNVTIDGVTTTKTIAVSSFAKELFTPESATISMSPSVITFLNKGSKWNVNDWTDATVPVWGDGSVVRFDKANTSNIATSRPYGTNIEFFTGTNSTLPQLGMKVRLADGTYKVEVDRWQAKAGCKYDVYVDGILVGNVDCIGNADATTPKPWSSYKPGESSTLSFGTVNVSSSDSDGWVSVKLVATEGNTLGDTYTAALYLGGIKFTPTAKVHVTADTPHGEDRSLITCEGDYEIGTIADVPFKTNLVLTANDTETNKFLYWINSSTKQVISEEATLSLSVTSNASISAVYAESGNTRYDYFTATGQRIASHLGSAPATEPEIPAMVGFATGGEWSEKNSYETDDGDYIAYAPDYTNAEPLTFKTTIDGEEKTVTYDEEITVTADEPDFSYWTKGGKTVSFMNSYTFFAWGDEIVEKICGVSVPAKERKPQVVLFNRGNDYMLELVACEDVEVIEKGILFAESGTPTIGSTIAKVKSNSDSKQFTVNWDYSVARAYLVYKDDAGATKVVYSDVISQ